ncbi:MULTISPECIES: hypothetical protein [Hyphobacterium]|uniref:Oxidoreductase molybdopterin-binding domain-containing protein n=1 Tax=Hyphobacterium vulgare TaxID=1736751 RepID=A0ABV6ZXY7_9PROT
MLRTILITLLAGFLAACSAGDSLASGPDPVMLTVHGDVTDTNRGAMEADREPLFARYDMAFDEARSFTRAELLALEQNEIVVRYPLGGAAHTFTGPRLSAVLGAAGANGERAIVSAFDGYQRFIPVADLRSRGVILALTRDGAPLTIGDYGPAMLVWPRDDDATLAGQNDDDWVWGVFAIEIVPE